ncbi:hypothetical protein ACVIHI_009107 [Bradyrhizobium sp. USDA 4524]|uniref:hypothetical protein n=1 Tax=unclassified Bradyrhizobium TaxID=2631580 RepID=UPI0020A0E42E|nr:MULTISPECIES: hypothetical protein [unclassified Bradyrhizobium]MCP1846114.1 hypothetical protein [Bradyrhizobium sp. USDA 4538]MCP1907251.1 hypothetical protein [Bradyrhizobium sp. USDA 4537]MCP1985727.1 hypothetical protein [Bradyrhizobium sp. USDA 4539]
MPRHRHRSEQYHSLAADVLLLLSSFSLRGQFIAKAVLYGRVGVSMFPDDLRLREIYTYALYLDGRIDEAIDVIQSAQVDTPNVSFLKMRLALHASKPASERRAAVRSYLKAERKT